MRQLKLSKAFTLMESVPVVLVTTHDGHKDNIMTLSWTMVLDFTAKFAIATGAWNHSYAALVKTRECVIAIPTVDLLDTVVEDLEVACHKPGHRTCPGAHDDIEADVVHAGLEHRRLRLAREGLSVGIERRRGESEGRCDEEATDPGPKVHGDHSGR